MVVLDERGIPVSAFCDQELRDPRREAGLEREREREREGERVRVNDGERERARARERKPTVSAPLTGVDAPPPPALATPPSCMPLLSSNLCNKSAKASELATNQPSPAKARTWS